MGKKCLQKRNKKYKNKQKSYFKFTDYSASYMLLLVSLSAC